MLQDLDICGSGEVLLHSNVESAIVVSSSAANLIQVEYLFFFFAISYIYICIATTFQLLLASRAFSGK